MQNQHVEIAKLVDDGVDKFAHQPYVVVEPFHTAPCSWRPFRLPDSLTLVPEETVATTKTVDDTLARHG
jgi:hypothetical protein